jgi:hypothetical protein
MFGDIYLEKIGEEPSTGMIVTGLNKILTSVKTHQTYWNKRSYIEFVQDYI